MTFHNLSIPRRQFIKTSATAAGMAALSTSPLLSAAKPSKRRPKIAVVFTVFRHRSHAHVLLENFLHPYLFNGQKTDSGVDMVSWYGDQFPAGDMSRAASKKYNIPIYKTIDAALCRGGKELAVDAVLLIGEHGDYPVNELGQRKYPRKRFFDETVAVMKRSGRFVPIFNDKHLSYRWDWAKAMYDEAQALGIPFLAGSSVPLAHRRPPMELPANCQIEEAVSIHGGPLESYDFHGLEVLQSMVEARRGGESGISSVEFLPTEALKKAYRDEPPLVALATAAMKAELGKAPSSLLNIAGEENKTPHGIRLHYKDGLKATVLSVGKKSTRWNFACRIKGESKIPATSFYTGPWRNRNLFKALAHAIQQHFIHARAPYPIQRTLLTTGTLESVMRARQQGKPLATPHLEFAYAPSREFRAMREMGASWKIINETTPEPEGINPGPVQ